MRRFLLTFAIGLIASAVNADGFRFSEIDKYGNKLQTCSSGLRCTTMPNPKDLAGLQIRQVLTPERRLIFISPAAELSCNIRDRNENHPFRIKSGELPIAVNLKSRDTVRIECVRAAPTQTIIFYVPAIEYAVPLR